MADGGLDVAVHYEFDDSEADQIYVTSDISVEAFHDGEGVVFVPLMDDDDDLPYLTPSEAVALAYAILKRFE